MSPNDYAPPTARPDDPAGIRARIPELESFAHDPAIRRAIESGSSHKVHRALLWAHMFGRTGAQGAVAAKLLADRRLFLEPLRSNPGMFTLNGVGTMLHGRSEERPDGSYIATLFLVALFLPVVPLGAYLVQNAGGRSYRFYGRVPLSAMTLVWQGLAGVGVVFAALLGATAMWWHGSHTTLHVVNGLPIPVVARVANADLSVPAGAHADLELTMGAQSISIRDASGAVIQEEAIEAYAGERDLFFNVLGAAPVFREEILYSQSGLPPSSEPDHGCGRSLIHWGSTDYVFVEPPATISMSSHTSSTTRTHVDVIEGGWELCAGVVADQHGLGEALGLLTRVAGALQFPPELLGLAYVIDDGTDPSAMIAFVDRVRTAHPESIDAHRMYQTLAIGEGRRDEVRADYAARAASAPDSGDLAYLAARSIPGEDGDRAMEAVTARFPENVYAHRARAYDLYSTGRWAESIAEADACAALGGEGFIGPRAAALVRLDRAPEALPLLEHAIAEASGVLEQRPLALIYSGIAASLGSADPGSALRACGFGTPASRILAQLEARLPLAPGDQELLEEEDRVVGDLLAAAPTDPYHALVLAESLTPRAVHMLSADVSTLLFAEAARTDPTSPAAVRLRAGTTVGHATLDDVARYVTTGETSAEIEQLDPQVRAVVWLVRSRAEQDPVAREALVARARQDDVFSGWASAALAGWPAP